MHAGVMRRTLFCILHTGKETVRKAIPSTDEAHANILLVHLRDLLLQERIKEIEQKIDFPMWALPILC